MGKQSAGILWSLAIAFLALPILAEQPQPSPQILKPLKITTRPIIDGKLDEPFWAEAPSVTGFKTYTPDYGRDLSENTLAFMAYDSENIYYAFRCFDREPQKIKASIARRDDIRPDDWVCINLDTFNDQQSLYAFYVNPLGIQMDSRYSSDKEALNEDFVWYSGGQIDEKGYSVEIRIPLKSIRYSSKSRVEMGIIFERRISRRTEHGTSPPLSPERGYFFLTQMAPIEYFGLKNYTLLEILPAFTYSQKYSLTGERLNRDKPDPELSLTGKYGLTSSLILDGTYNPDFSQVEADAGQVDANLRYDLYYPEKRPFFLEGLDNFNLSGSSEDDYLQAAVYTRNIIEPKAGVKVTGKIAKKDTLATIFAADEGEAGSDIPPGNSRTAYFSIARYKHALSQDSYLGLFVTDRDEGGAYNRVLGPDGRIRLTQSSQLSFYAFGSFTKGPSDSSRADGHALLVDYFYDTRDWQIEVGAQDISEEFQTEVGYLIRNGLTRFRATINPRFYPPSSVLPRIDLILFSSQLKDQPSGIWETEDVLALSFTLVKSSRITLGYAYATEVYRAQRFRTGGWEITAQGQLSKQFRCVLFFRDGQAIRYTEFPYQGRGRDAQASLVFQPSEKINWTLDITYSDLFREANSEKIFDYTIIRNRLTYQVNKYLFFRGVIEYNSFRRQILTDLLASFTYIPGTVLQLGYGSLYNQVRWQEDEYVPSEKFLETRRGLFFKASYLWRI